MSSSKATMLLLLLLLLLQIDIIIRENWLPRCERHTLTWRLPSAPVFATAKPSVRMLRVRQNATATAEDMGSLVEEAAAAQSGVAKKFRGRTIVTSDATLPQAIPMKSTAQLLLLLLLLLLTMNEAHSRQMTFRTQSLNSPLRLSTAARVASITIGELLLLLLLLPSPRLAFASTPSHQSSSNARTCASTELLQCRSSLLRPEAQSLTADEQL
jgi:hypothetical protein